MQKINKKTIIFIIITAIVSICIYYFFITDKEYIENNNNLDIVTEAEESKKIENNKTVIYITGAVKNEGIYELDENSRIADAIEKAGGLNEDANIQDINLAYIVEDGMKIYIPKKSEKSNEIQNNTNEYIVKENGNAKSSKNNNEKVNINTATQAELETLPGIGPSIAVKIINYRKENGKFAKIEDIKKVSGIGENKYSKIKELIKI
jgi:competence protein comEA helix-hairpin-helix repeat region